MNTSPTSRETTLPITLATAAVKVIATGVSAKKLYVCQINLNNNAADTVAVFEATTATVCATAAVAVVGAGTSVATAGTGYNFAATGGPSDIPLFRTTDHYNPRRSSIETATAA